MACTFLPKHGACTPKVREYPRLIKLANLSRRPLLGAASAPAKPEAIRGGHRLSRIAIAATRSRTELTPKGVDRFHSYRCDRRHTGKPDLGGIAGPDGECTSAPLTSEWPTTQTSYCWLQPCAVAATKQPAERRTARPGGS